MLLEARQGMPAVVAPGHHLEQHAAERGLGGAQALAQHRGQRARAIDELPDQVGPSAGLRVRGKLRELLLGLPVGRLGGGLDHRTIEVVESNLPGEVGDDRIPAFGGCREAIEQLAEVLAHLSGQGIDLLEPAIQEGDDGDSYLLGAPLRQEEPVAGLLQLRRSIQTVDAVVGHGPLEQTGEPVGQPLPLDVE